jgi:VWFA-related protein
MKCAIRVVASCVMTAGVFAQQPAQQPPLFRATGDAVRVDVTVTRADGSIVRGLTVNDFEVLDNGRPQTITGFVAEAQPVTVGVLLDVSESNIDAAPALEAGTLAFIESMRPSDRASIGSLNLHLAGILRSDRDHLREDLSQLEGNAGSLVWKLVEDRARSLRTEPGRRAILLATDGLDTGDWLMANLDSTREGLKEILNWTLPSNEVMGKWLLSGVRNGLTYRGIDDDAIQLYVVQTGKGQIQKDLRAVAEGSGGRVIDGRKLASLDRTFVSVLEELRQQYVVAFEPPERDGKIHRLEVRLKPAGLRARHRGAYVAAGVQ